MTRIKKEGPRVPPSLKHKRGLDLYDMSQEQLMDILAEFEPLDFDAIQEELDDIPVVNLSKDPTTVGITILSEHLAEVQSYKNRVSDLRMQCLKSKAIIDKIRRMIEYQYEVKMHSLLLDEDIIKLKNVGQQKAAAAEQMPEWLKRIQFGVKEHVAELEMFLKNVEAKHNELHDANANLSRQVTVAQIEVSLFSR